MLRKTAFPFNLLSSLFSSIPLLSFSLPFSHYSSSSYLPSFLFSFSFIPSFSTPSPLFPSFLPSLPSLPPFFLLSFLSSSFPLHSRCLGDIPNSPSSAGCPHGTRNQTWTLSIQSTYAAPCNLSSPSPFH